MTAPTLTRFDLAHWSRYTAFTAISMAAGVSFAFPALWLSSYVWNTRAPGGALKPQHGRSWLVRPAAVRGKC